MFTRSVLPLLAICSIATAQSTVVLLNPMIPSFSSEPLQVTIADSSGSITTYNNVCPATPTSSPASPTEGPSSIIESFASSNGVSTTRPSPGFPKATNLCLGGSPFTLIQGPGTWEYHQTISEEATIAGTCTWEGELSTADISCTTGAEGPAPLVPTAIAGTKTVVLNNEKLSAMRAFQPATILEATTTGGSNSPAGPTNAAAGLTVPIAAMGGVVGMLGVAVVL